MAHRQRPSNSTTDAAELPAYRGWLSLLVIVHFLAVGAATFGFPDRSGVQNAVLTVVAPYVQVLNFDPGSAEPWPALYLTYGDEVDVDYFLEFLPSGGDPENPRAWRRLDENVVATAGHRRWRHRRLAEALSYFDDEQYEETTAGLALAIARYCQARYGERPDRIRCRRRLLQSASDIHALNPLRRNPADPMFFETSYEALVLAEGARMRLLRLSPADQSAPSTFRAGS